MSGDRKPSKYTHRVVEQVAAPQLTAQPVPRKATPIGMPAPPPNASHDRESHDDIDQVVRVDQLERERAQLLVKLQDTESENRLLRETAPTVIFPPPSIPPPPSSAKPIPRPKDSDRPPSKLPAQLMHLATGLGIFVAIAWNAFNTHRSNPDKVDAVQARVAQSDREREQEIAQRTLERQRTLQALRASQCMFKQLRGALQRQGLDLQSLPPGGITVVKVAPDDPNRPGAPAFISQEVCPGFPELPPEIPSR